MNAVEHTGPSEVLCGGCSIGYVVRRSRGRTLRILVSGPDEVEVRAPPHVSAGAVQSFVRQHADWIASALERQGRKPRLVPRAYKTGETFYYLGKPLRLEVVHSVWKKVTLEEGVLRVAVYDLENPRRIKALVDEWYGAQAERSLAAWLEQALGHYRMMIRHPRCALAMRSDSTPDGVRLTVRAMKTRWGSCSPDGHITLSMELMHVPRRLIEYVIVHELCHLVRLDHSKAYYFQLARCLPDWKQRRQELETRAWMREQATG